MYGVVQVPTKFHGSGDLLNILLYQNLYVIYYLAFFIGSPPNLLSKLLLFSIAIDILKETNMSKQLMAMTVRLDPKDKQVAFLRLDGIGIKQFTQLTAQYQKIKKINSASKSEVIRWIIAQYTATPCNLESL